MNVTDSQTTDRQTTDGRIAYSKREREFKIAKNCILLSLLKAAFNFFSLLYDCHREFIANFAFSAAN